LIISGEYRSRTDDLLHAMPFLANFKQFKKSFKTTEYQLFKRNYFAKKFGILDPKSLLLLYLSLILCEIKSDRLHTYLHAPVIKILGYENFDHTNYLDISEN
jgi:hypothetical protein